MLLVLMQLFREQAFSRFAIKLKQAQRIIPLPFLALRSPIRREKDGVLPFAFLGASSRAQSCYLWEHFFMQQEEQDGGDGHSSRIATLLWKAIALLIA